MDIQQLRYFLAVAQEKNITRASQLMRISQPALSRQLQRLEDDLGKPLFQRTKSGVSLTEEGFFLAERAREVVALTDKITANFQTDDVISGELHIGGGETEAILPVIDAVNSLQQKHPGITAHLYSGNADDVTDKLEKGLLDFGIVIAPAVIHDYDYMRLPARDRWGLLAHRTSPLSGKASVTADDLCDLPLLISRQTYTDHHLSKWLGADIRTHHVVATYNLLFNASLMVREKTGYALCLDRIINTTGTDLTFLPLDPPLEVDVHIIWKKEKTLSKPAKKFLEQLQQILER